MLSLALYAMTTPESDVWFDQTEMVHSRLSAGAFTAVSKVTGVDGAAPKSYEVKFRWPREYRLRTVEAKSGRLVRDVSLEPGRVVDYNPALGQFTSNRRDPKEPTRATIARVEEGIDELIAGFASPDGIKEWLAPLRKLRPWSTRVSGAKKTLTYKAGGKVVSLDLRKADSRIGGVSIQTGAQTLVWDMKYSSTVSGLRFVPQAGVCEVPVFDQDMMPPKYEGAEAKATATKMFDAYNGLSSLGYTVRREGGATKVTMRGKFVRQDDGLASWTYDGSVLTAFVKGTRQWYTGRLTFTDVIDAVGDLGTRVDPTLRLLMTGFNPYRKRLGDGATVKYAGTMKLHGEPATILESTSDNARITLIVRDKDGLVASTSVQSTPGAPTVEADTDLIYEYFSVANNVAKTLRLTPPRDGSVTRLEPKVARN